MKRKRFDIDLSNNNVMENFSLMTKNIIKDSKWLIGRRKKPTQRSST